LHATTTVFGGSSTSRSSAAPLASSCCFLKPSVIGATMRGSKMALKISLFSSMATKWRPALRQAWKEAPVGNEGRCTQKSQNKKSQGHEREVYKKLRICGCSAINNYVANLHERLNEQLEKERVLLPTSSPRSIAFYELSVLCYKIKEDMINGSVDTNKIKLSHRANGEGGRRPL
jgi:hypothetical protein